MVAVGLAGAAACAGDAQSFDRDDAASGDVTVDPGGEAAVDAGATNACGRVAPELPTLRVEVDGPTLRDALGREVWLRGVNTGGRSKFPPYAPFPFAESGWPGQESAPGFEAAVADYFDTVASWGHNVVRMPFSWEAFEPVQGAFDAAWLARYRAMIAAAEDRGIRVIVDFHQDLWARPYCGDGAPLWTLPDPVPPLPGPDDCDDWFFSYLTDPDDVVFPAFDRFWANEAGVRTAFEVMWRQMADSVVGHDAVIAFEVINEPHPGTADERDWGPEVLTPFFTTMVDVLRERAPGMPILFESSGTDATDQTFYLGLPEGGGLVWAPHYYDPRIYLGGVIDEGFSADVPMTTVAERAAAWNVPVLLGEFGARSSNPSTPLYLRRVYEALDRHGIHGTVWEFSTTVDDWNNEDFSVTGPGGSPSLVTDEVVRVYPRAVAGAVTSFAFDRGARTAVLEFSASAGGITELAAPSLLWPGGPEVLVTGDACAWWSSGVVYVHTPTSGAARVELRPR